MKNSHGGIFGVETIVAIPSAPTPMGCVPRCPLINTFVPKSNLSLVVSYAILLWEKKPGGARGYPKKQHNKRNSARYNWFKSDIQMCLCSYSTGHAEGRDKQKRCGIGKGRN